VDTYPNTHSQNGPDHTLTFQEWTEVFGSERLTGALLDRLTHHVHILEMNGDSYRLKQSRRNRRSQPGT
jgi:DNA replication protein DnaC